MLTKKCGVVTLLALLIILLFNGCSWVSSITAPRDLIDAVARGDAVATKAVNDPPKFDEDMKAYLQKNKELWDELARFYGLRR